jgi:transposase
MVKDTGAWRTAAKAGTRSATEGGFCSRRSRRAGTLTPGGGRHGDILWAGCQWKALPKDLPPKSTVHDYLELWNWDGTLERIHHALYVAVREQEGREASPTVAIIDSQTAKGTQKGGLGSILRATTRARRSRVASGTSWSTRWVSC